MTKPALPGQDCLCLWACMTGITSEGLNHLTEMPEHVTTSITELNLEHNPIGGRVAHFFSKLHALRSSKKLNSCGIT